MGGLALCLGRATSGARCHLALGLAASLLIHLLVVSRVRLPGNTMVQADPIRSLEVRLTVPAKVGAKAHTLNSTGHEEVNTAEPQAMRYPAPKVQADGRPDGRRAQPFQSIQVRKSEVPAMEAVSTGEMEALPDMVSKVPAAPLVNAITTPHPKPSDTSSVGLLATSLAQAGDLARAQIQNERQQLRPSADQPTAPIMSRPVLPALDEALRRPQPGEQRMGNGLLKVVSAGGRIYCFQVPPPSMGGGPVPILSVPTNCP